MRQATCNQAVVASAGVGVALSPVILLVEDDLLVRELMASELSEAGFAVAEAETAEEGLRLLSDAPPSLLFTDIRLPGRLNGWQLAEEARRLLPGLPVMYATGYTDESPRLVPGAVFLRKPYRANEMLLHIRRLLGLPASD